MSNIEIIILSLSIAFTWVEVLNPFKKTKPLNCLMCMTGWISGFIGIIVIGWPGLLFIPVGIFTGALFGAIQMRWL